jgi:1-deoxy-D-xylulose-5-phosphate synthase
MTPSDEEETRKLLTTGFHYKGPAAVRYPRGNATGREMDKELKGFEIGKANICREGKGGVALLVFGTLLTKGKIVAEELDATLVDMRFVKPIDEALIKTMATSHSLLVTLEENAIKGGAGSAVNEYLEAENLSVPILNLGLPDRFIEHGKADDMLAGCGLDVEGISSSIRQRQE